MTDLKLNVTRGGATMLYATASRDFCVRYHLRLDDVIDPDILRKAVSNTAKRFPYFSVTRKKNEKEYYYEENHLPIAVINTDKRITLCSEETNYHIWAVCYYDDNLFVDFYHGRSDGTGMYYLTATLLYYYFHEQYGLEDSTGIRTLDDPITEEETHDPIEDLPIIDLSTIMVPPKTSSLRLMEESGFEMHPEIGKFFKIKIPEEKFFSFSKTNGASPGVMLCVLMARSVGRLHSDNLNPIKNFYVANARPMLNAKETFHNCIHTVALHYDEKVRSMPLDKQCAVFRESTMKQIDEEKVRHDMTLEGSLSKLVMDIPDLAVKEKFAIHSVESSFSAATFVVSYVGRWKQTQLGEHVREFWIQSPPGFEPLLEVTAINGYFFVSFLQCFKESKYYDAFLEELGANGIEYEECGNEPVLTAGIVK